MGARRGGGGEPVLPEAPESASARPVASGMRTARLTLRCTNTAQRIIHRDRPGGLGPGRCGRDPANQNFGGHEIPTDSGVGHSDYWNKGQSLDAMGQIISGRW